MRAFFDKLYKGKEEELYTLLEDRLVNKQKTFIVTANPEVYMALKDHVAICQKMFTDETIITPDGEGIVYAAKKLGYTINGKIAGVDTVARLLKIGDAHQADVYFFGSKDYVLAALKKKIETVYPHLNIVGCQHGYIENREAVMQDILAKQPDLIFIALGVPAQEEEIAAHIDAFQKGIFVGCGGSLDVLSGTKARAPHFLVRMKLEWVYRIVKEPKRLKRFLKSNLKFLAEIRRIQ